MIEKILPPGVECAEALGDAEEVVLLPEEQELVARAVEKRRREFTPAARYGAPVSRALRDHGPYLYREVSSTHRQACSLGIDRATREHASPPGYISWPVACEGLFPTRPPWPECPGQFRPAVSATRAGDLAIASGTSGPGARRRLNVLPWLSIGYCGCMDSCSAWGARQICRWSRSSWRSGWPDRIDLVAQCTSDGLRAVTGLPAKFGTKRPPGQIRPPRPG